MGIQLGFYIDQSRCIGCKACQIACKDKNDLEVGRLYRRVSENHKGSFSRVGSAYTNNVVASWTSIACNHCIDPMCVSNCPTGAMHKREEDGVVVVDDAKCIGCRYCEWSCPYGAPQFNSQTGIMTKCDFCVDLMARGEDPACVAACPYQLIEYGPIDELRQKYGNLADIIGLAPSSITKPNLVITPHKGAELE